MADEPIHYEIESAAGGAAPFQPSTRMACGVVVTCKRGDTRLPQVTCVRCIAAYDKALEEGPTESFWDRLRENSRW